MQLSPQEIPKLDSEYFSGVEGSRLSRLGRSVVDLSRGIVPGIPAVIIIGGLATVTFTPEQSFEAIDQARAAVVEIIEDLTE